MCQHPQNRLRPALFAIVLAIVSAPLARPAAPGEIVERRVATMGTVLALEVEAPTRAQALAASEAALRALEAVEARLSTWCADSELARLNLAPAGAWFAVSPELEAELAAALRWSRATGGAFDPAVGGLVRAWGLRSGARLPSAEEKRAAIVAGGLAANLELAGGHAMRLDPRLCIEEGGFGKGAGLDAALRALAASGASAARLDLGGQVLLYERGDEDRGAVREAPHSAERIEIADPADRMRAVVAITVARGSISTSGNSEHGITVGGVRYGHLLDPRSGEPAHDFGSLTVWASDATAADCLSTGLYVLGPERALAFAAESEGIEVLVIETSSPGGALRARASAGFAGRLEALDPRLVLAFPADDASRPGCAERDPVPATPTTIR